MRPLVGDLQATFRWLIADSRRLKADSPPEVSQIRYRCEKPQGGVLRTCTSVTTVAAAQGQGAQKPQGEFCAPCTVSPKSLGCVVIPSSGPR